MHVVMMVMMMMLMSAFSSQVEACQNEKFEEHADV